MSFVFKTIKLPRVALVPLSALAVVHADPGASKSEVAPVPPISGVVRPISEPVHLGVSVSKPSAAVYAQLPQLPRGCGFLLRSVTPGGSADIAGLRQMDLIWKLGDQLLVNEGQMMTLLSLRRPGDELSVSFFRFGEMKTAVVKFQAGNARVPQSEAIAITPPFPGFPGTPSLPMRVISYEDRSASISDSNGTATLTFREGKRWLHVEDSRGVEIFNGSVVDASDIARVPVVWRGRLPILQRSLEESIRLRKLPRVRRVPTPRHRIAGDGGAAGGR